MIYLYTDGACSGNPGPGGYGAVLWDIKSNKVLELGGHQADTTNNQMEMTAIIEGLKALNFASEVTVLSDSSYVLNGITKWIHGWKKRNWAKSDGAEVLNKTLWIDLDQLNSRHQITWQYVPGHAGLPGNERCDAVAVAFSKGEPVHLYKGDIREYSVDLGLDSVKLETALAQKKSSKGKGATNGKKAYSYVSVVNGTVYVDATWAECEKRVKGVSGARFKKALSLAEQEELVQRWG